MITVDAAERENAYCYQSINVIKLIQIDKLQLTLLNLLAMYSLIFCYHLFNVISLSKSDHFKRLPLCTLIVSDPQFLGLFGGIINKGRMPGRFQIDSTVFFNVPDEWTKRYDRRTLRMQCFPLFSILMALGNPTIDLFRQ